MSTNIIDIFSDVEVIGAIVKKGVPAINVSLSIDSSKQDEMNELLSRTNAEIKYDSNDVYTACIVIWDDGVQPYYRLEATLTHWKSEKSFERSANRAVSGEFILTPSEAQVFFEKVEKKLFETQLWKVVKGDFAFNRKPSAISQAMNQIRKDFGLPVKDKTRTKSIFRD